MGSKLNVLVVGSGSYIAKNTIPVLEKEHNVFTWSMGWNLEDIFVDCDIDVVINFVNYFTNDCDQISVDKLLESNVRFPTKLAHLCYEHNVKRFINFGTFQQHYLGHGYNPVNLYSATKKAFQDILKYYHESGKFEVINLDLNSVFGPNDYRPKLIPTLLSAMETGKVLSFTSPEKVVNLVSVDFVARTINDFVSCYSINEEFGSHRNFIVAGGDISFVNLIRLVEEKSGKKIKHTYGKASIEREMMFHQFPHGILVLKDDKEVSEYIEEIIREKKYVTFS
jgi:nucleoside-diphosphate-sugar epimerase